MAACRFNIIVRAFSSSSPSSQLVKTPVQVFGVGGRYATAIYSAGVKTKELDGIEKELLSIQNAIKTDKKFRQFVKDPTIKRSVKTEAFKQASTKLSLSNTSKNALSLIAENGRLKDFDQIVNAFKILMAAHRGEVTCEVISAKPLDDATKKEVEATLKKFAKSNQTIIMTSKVDPTIIGGLIITIGDKYVDMSIATKIKKYTQVLQTAV